MISNCGNDTLLQATAENKQVSERVASARRDLTLTRFVCVLQFVKRELRSDKYQPRDIAVYPAALEFAFKLLRVRDAYIIGLCCQPNATLRKSD